MDSAGLDICRISSLGAKLIFMLNLISDRIPSILKLEGGRTPDTRPYIRSDIRPLLGTGYSARPEAKFNIRSDI